MDTTELKKLTEHEHGAIKKQATRLLSLVDKVKDGTLSDKEFKELAGDIITSLELVKESNGIQNKIQLNKLINIAKLIVTNLI